MSVQVLKAKSQARSNKGAMYAHAKRDRGNKWRDGGCCLRKAAQRKVDTWKQFNEVQMQIDELLATDLENIEQLKERHEVEYAK